MNEEWRDVTGYEGLYQVSNTGKVKSLDRYVKARSDSKMIKRGTVMKLQESHKGYCIVSLHKENNIKSFSVHRLVAEAFIPNPMRKPQVNHKDCDKKNNMVSNLEWCTQDENMRHASDNGIYNNKSSKQLSAIRKNQLIASEKRKKAVNQYSVDGLFIRQFASMTEAEKETGTSLSKISMCCNGKRKKANGYKWGIEKEKQNG